MNVVRKMRRKAEKEIFKNVSSDWLNEEDFKSCSCNLCGEEIVSVYDSHNPYPLGKNTFAVLENVKNNPERCCKTCNENLVIPARFAMTCSPAGVAKFRLERDRDYSDLVKIIRRNSKPAYR
jgi:hypothetical protein